MNFSLNKKFPEQFSCLNFGGCLIGFSIFALFGCYSIRLKDIQPDNKYNSEIRIEGYAPINPETNGGYNREFTAVWKKSLKESVSMEMLLKVENEKYEMWPLYGVWAVASGYSGTLIPYYRKFSRLMFLKSKNGDLKKDYELEFEECIGILLLNCSIFNGFESDMALRKRFENEIVSRAAYDYLQRNEQNRK